MDSKSPIAVRINPPIPSRTSRPPWQLAVENDRARDRAQGTPTPRNRIARAVGRLRPPGRRGALGVLASLLHPPLRR